MLRLLTILLFFVLATTQGLGQSQISNLKHQIDTITNDTVKAALLRHLGNTYRKTNYDSSMFFYMQSVELAQKINRTDEEAQTLRFIGITQKNRGNIDSALICYRKSLQLHLKNRNEKEAAFVYNNMGIVYKNLGKYEAAITEYIRALKIFDKIDDTYGKALVYNNIGIVHKNQERFDLAIEYYYKALEMNKKKNRLDPMASNYNNIGVLLLRIGQQDSALSCYKKARELRLKDNDEVGVADSDMHIGSYYSAKNDWKQAIEYYTKSLPILKKHKDINSLIHGYYNIAQAKNNYAKEIKHSASMLNQAEEYALKSLKLANKIGYLVGQKSGYELLSKIYTKKKQYKKSLENYANFVLINDSLFNLDRSKQMAITEAKYNTEKKQLEIEKLESQKALDNEKIVRQELENKKQKQLKYIFLLGIVILVLFVIYVLRNLKGKKQANTILLKQKAEIAQQNENLNQMVEEITTQKEEIESQRDRVEQQNQLLADINTDVSNSIEYAKKIQRAILTDTKVLNKYISDAFVFFKPRDVVSGDFYWWAKVEDQLVVTAADSTGHGVPGAFMSMLGVSFLREIVMKEYITHPGVILRRMRKEIINALRQKQESIEHSFSTNKDGMDMALISLNIHTNLLQYAGANNPLYIVTSNELQGFDETSKKAVRMFDNPKQKHQNSKILYELRPDKMPISIYDKMERFTTHEIQLQPGDLVYMFSDGFADQFGGAKGKKFKYKPFKKLLLDNAHLPMEQQKEALYQKFMGWKDTEEQVDDIVVVGIKI